MIKSEKTISFFKKNINSHQLFKTVTRVIRPKISYLKKPNHQMFENKIEKKSIIQKDLKPKITIKKMMIKVEIKNKLEKNYKFFY